MPTNATHTIHAYDRGSWNAYSSRTNNIMPIITHTYHSSPLHLCVCVCACVCVCVCVCLYIYLVVLFFTVVRFFIGIFLYCCYFYYVSLCRRLWPVFFFFCSSAKPCFDSSSLLRGSLNWLMYLSIFPYSRNHILSKALDCLIHSPLYITCHWC